MLLWPSRCWPLATKCHDQQSEDATAIEQHRQLHALAELASTTTCVRHDQVPCALKGCIKALVMLTRMSWEATQVCLSFIETLSATQQLDNNGFRMLILPKWVTLSGLARASNIGQQCLHSAKLFLLSSSIALQLCSSGAHL